MIGAGGPGRYTEEDYRHRDRIRAKRAVELSRKIREKGRASSDLDPSILIAGEHDQFVPRSIDVRKDRRRRRQLVDELDLTLVDPRESRIEAKGKVIKDGSRANDFFGIKGDSFRNAPLAEVDFTGVTIIHANADGADFSNARLVGADLRGTSFNQANFEGADLQNAKLGYTMWQGANLQGADLSGANFEEADLRGAWFDEETNVEGADFQSALLEQSTIGLAQNVEAASWSADMPPEVRARLEDATLEMVGVYPSEQNEMDVSPEIQEGTQDFSVGVEIDEPTGDMVDPFLDNITLADGSDSSDMSITLDDDTPIAYEDDEPSPPHHSPPRSNYRSGDIKSSAPKPRAKRKSGRHPFWKRGENKKR